MTATATQPCVKRRSTSSCTPPQPPELDAQWIACGVLTAEDFARARAFAEKRQRAEDRYAAKCLRERYGADLGGLDHAD